MRLNEEFYRLGWVITCPPCPRGKDYEYSRGASQWYTNTTPSVNIIHAKWVSRGIGWFTRATKRPRIPLPNLIHPWWIDQQEVNAIKRSFWREKLALDNPRVQWNVQAHLQTYFRRVPLTKALSGCVNAYSEYSKRPKWLLQPTEHDSTVWSCYLFWEEISCLVLLVRGICLKYLQLRTYFTLIGRTKQNVSWDVQTSSAGNWECWRFSFKLECHYVLKIDNRVLLWLFREIPLVGVARGINKLNQT